jgi:hypothetical protein
MVAGVVGFVTSYLNDRGPVQAIRMPSRDEFIFVAGLIGLIIYVFLVSRIYDWRRARRASGYGDGVEGDVERVSILGGLHHVAGYLVGFAMGTAASIQLDNVWLRLATFIVAFLAGKLLMDVTAPSYRNLARHGVPQALMRMAVVSPVWWGLPWALVLGGGWVVIGVHDALSSPYYLKWMVETALLPFLVVVTAGFSVIALVAVAGDLLEGQLFQPSGDVDDGWSRGDWMRAYICVAISAGLALSYMVKPLPKWGSELYGLETWTCAERDGEYAVGWVPRAGVHITVHDTRVELFDASCVPRRDGDGCDYDDAGWDRLTFSFQGADGPDEISFTRGEVDVPTGYRHHADLLVHAAYEVVTRLQRNRSFTLHIIAPKARELYALNVSLAGFNKAYDTCAVRWREQARQMQAGRIAAP